jgi:hypothetical protein
MNTGHAEDLESGKETVGFWTVYNQGGRSQRMLV